jgi:hypothetical protein
LQLFHLREGGYEAIDRSELPGLENLNIAVLPRCILMAETDFPGALALFRQASIEP